MLTGSELLAKVKQCEGINKTEMARACGYTVEKDGRQRVKFAEFYAALLEAKGIDLGVSADEPKGRKLSYRAKVQFNGKLQIGEGYMRQMGMEPGDEFEINVGRKHITLTAIQPA